MKKSTKGRLKMAKEGETITSRIKLDARGRLHLRAEDREYLDLKAGDLLEVTIRKVIKSDKPAQPID